VLKFARQVSSSGRVLWLLQGVWDRGARELLATAWSGGMAGRSNLVSSGRRRQVAAGGEVVEQAREAAGGSWVVRLVAVLALAPESVGRR
jgi:hypothetical protein